MAQIRRDEYIAASYPDTMSYRIAGRPEWSRALFLTVAMSLALALGFIPTTREFFRWIAWLVGGHMTPELYEFSNRAAFPILATFFYVSLPRARPRPRPEVIDTLFLVEISVVPVLIALVFGALRSSPTIFELLKGDQWIDVVWYVLMVPIGEEMLFRGWLYEIANRLAPQWGSATNPLPMAIYLTAVGFSLWHVQNGARDPLGSVFFQVAYTFGTGIWLGILRWRSQRVYPGILAHIAINTAAGIF